MLTILQALISLLLTASMHSAMADATQITPAQAADEFMRGISTVQEETLDRHAGNGYVNFISNVKGSDEVIGRMQTALFQNFTYEIEDTAQRGAAAVAKVDIQQCDFSDVLKKYEKESYDYVTEHLYDEDVTDKKKLSAKCLDIYVSQIEKDAKKGKTKDETVYIVMEADGYNGWNVTVDDESMEKILGNLAIPEEVDVKGKQ